MKKCNRCNSWYGLDRFTKDNRTESGRSSTCKACHVRQCTEWRMRNKTRVATRKRERELQKPPDNRLVCYYAMIARCYNIKNPKYPRYGGRGISVCPRWRHSFKNFFTDMGKRPFNTTLGRINNNGNYEPSNCRWENAYQQARNKSSNIVLETDIGEMLMEHACSLYGINQSIISKKVSRGDSHQEAFNYFILTKGLRVDG